uniref:Uncharacterized protein n=1 Tax=Phlebotomus papatasi TaxID=29031 RepID=A0A1B0D7B6_PHLPP
MSEVSENSGENATEKMNGDINGACDEDEAMDVDSQSQDESVTTSLKEANIEEVTTEDNDDSTVDSNGQDHDPLGGDGGTQRGGSNSGQTRAAKKSGKDSEKVNGHGTDDDDNAVIIHSDSDSDVVATDIDLSGCDKSRNGTEVHEILSDKEDCVVIEDTKDQQRRSSRQRKPMVKVRDYSTYDEEDDDIEEIVEDPLTERPSMLKKAKMLPQDLSVTPVNRMPEVKSSAAAAAAAAAAAHQKEPTLVIIDTNTMLNSRTAGNSMMQSIKNASSVVNTSASTTSGYSVMPVGVPAQGVYPPNIRATITPVTPSSSSSSIMPKGLNLTPPQMQPPVLLPALTDDMFVLEAPSFIVPYIYEKPPQDDLKEVVQKMSVELEELRKKEESEMEQESEESGGEDGENAASTGAAASKEAEGEEDKEKSSKKGRRRRKKNPDDSWDESDTSTDEEASDSEERTKVLIKEAKEDLDTIKKAHYNTRDGS